MREQTGVKGIGTKVLVGFSAIFLSVVVAGFINFISLNKLVHSVKVLSEPDPKLDNLHLVLEVLSE